MNHLPYFKFHCNDWANGDISLEDYGLQGLFINICCYYWSRKGDVTLDQTYKKFRDKESINILKDLGFLKIKYNKISITFLDEQLQSFQDKAETSRKNGKKGGRPKITQTKPTGLLAHNPEKPNIDKIREEEDKIRKDKKRDGFKLTAFDTFRKAYPGTKRGLDTEFTNFKKHKDWFQVVFDLSALLDCQINCREIQKKAGQFVPEWKHLQTWINQRCWEEETTKPKPIEHNPFN